MYEQTQLSERLLGSPYHMKFQDSSRLHNKRKGKEEYLYSAIYYACIVSKRSDMDHTLLPAN